MHYRYSGILIVGFALCAILGALWAMSLVFEFRYNGYQGGATTRLMVSGGALVVWDATNEIRTADRLRQVVLRARRLEGRKTPNGQEFREVYPQVADRLTSTLKHTEPLLERLPPTIYVGPRDGRSGTLSYHGMPRVIRSPLGWRIIVPLWTLMLLVAVVSCIIWRMVPRRAVPGHCRKCGYDLTGNVSGKCPECGTEISSSENKCAGGNSAP